MLDVGWVIGWGKGVLPAGYDVRFLSWLRVSLCLRCYLRCLRNWANRGHAPTIWGWWFPPICRWYGTILHEHFDASDQRPPLIGDFQWFWRDWSIAKETDLHWCGWHFTWERPLARGHPWTRDGATGVFDQGINWTQGDFCFRVWLVIVPSGYVKIAIENDHWNSEFSH